MVLNNTTGSGVSFYAEGWRGHTPAVNPYYGTEGLFKSDPTQLLTTQFMRAFPWSKLQMLKRGTTCTNAAVQCAKPTGWPNAGTAPVAAATTTATATTSTATKTRKPKGGRRRRH